MAVEDLPTEEFFAEWVHRNQMALRSWDFPTSPAWNTAPHALKAATVLAPAIGDIGGSVVETDYSAVLHAASPWHAALYCQLLQYRYSSSGSRLLFRGQRNYSWELQPTILRTTDMAAEEARNELFAAILSAMSFNTVMSFHPYSNTRVFLKMSKDAYLAAAQHYGMKTYFLDFTTDPDVAVKFAAAEEDSDDRIGVDTDPHPRQRGGTWVISCSAPAVCSQVASTARPVR